MPHTGGAGRPQRRTGGDVRANGYESSSCRRRAPSRRRAARGGDGVAQFGARQADARQLVRDKLILRGEFGFGDRYVLSDCNDVPALVSFRVAANLSHAAAKGLAGGVDLDLQCGDQSATHLADALADGATTVAAVRAAAKRVLMSKFAPASSTHRRSTRQRRRRRSTRRRIQRSRSRPPRRGCARQE